MRPEDYRLDVHVRDLAALVGELGIGPVHVVGNSQGGNIALRFVMDYPELVRTAAIGEPGEVVPLADGEEAQVAAERRQQMVLVDQLVDAGDLNTAARRLFEMVVGQKGAFERLSMSRQQRWLANAHTLRLRERARATVSNEGLAGIRRPVLVFRGAETSPYYRATTRALLGRLPSGTRELVIPDAGHMSYADNAEAFTRGVLEFVVGR